MTSIGENSRNKFHNGHWSPNILSYMVIHLKYLAFPFVHFSGQDECSPTSHPLIRMAF